jgi:hypothetical protein
MISVPLIHERVTVFICSLNLLSVIGSGSTYHPLSHLDAPDDESSDDETAMDVQSLAGDKELNLFFLKGSDVDIIVVNDWISSIKSVSVIIVVIDTLTLREIERRAQEIC